jgi:hypothetical protein
MPAGLAGAVVPGRLAILGTLAVAVPANLAAAAGGSKAASALGSARW